MRMTMGLTIESLKFFLDKYLPKNVNFKSAEIPLKCPFHKNGQEKHPSMYLNTEKLVVFCHTCKIGMSFFDMLLKLGFDYETIQSVLDNNFLSLNTTETKNKEPEIYPEESLNLFELAYSLIPNISKELIEYFNIRYSKYYDALIFPYYNEFNKYIGFSMRPFKEKSYRWFKGNSEAKSSNCLWGLNKFYYRRKDLPYLILVEGVKKVLHLVENGYTYTVALSGSYLSSRQRTLLSDIKAGKLVIMTDGDDVGQKCARQIFNLLKNSYIVDYSSVKKIQPDELNKSELTKLIGF
jgi:DNA primase